MTLLGNWITGIVCALIGLGSLFLAGHAQDPMFAFFGVVMFIFMVIMVFALMKTGYDRHDAMAHGHDYKG